MAFRLSPWVLKQTGTMCREYAQHALGVLRPTRLVFTTQKDNTFKL